MINRHIFLELFKNTLISVIALTLLLLYGNLTRYDDVLLKAIEQSSPLLLKLCLLLVPYALSMAIPFGFTLALSLVLGSWASNNEITAVNSLGISPIRTFAPFGIFSLILSSVSIFSSVQWGPENRAKFDELREQVLWHNLSHLLMKEGEISYEINSDIDSPSRQSFSSLIGANENNKISKVSLSVKDFENNIWRNLRITLFDQNNHILMVIHSGKTIVAKSIDKGQLSLDLYDVDLEPVKKNGKFFQGGSDLFVNIAHMEQPLIIEISQREKKNLKRLGISDLYKIASESEVLDVKNKARAILHKNFALGCSPFFVCLLIVPISVKIGRKETILNLFLGILICVSYYTLGTIGSNFFENYSWNYLSWWIPNIFFLFLALLIARPRSA